MAQQIAPQPLPPAASQLAAMYQLGVPMAAYKPWLRPSGIFTSATLALIALIFLLESFIGPDPDASSKWLVFGLIFIAASLIYLADYLLLHARPAGLRLRRGAGANQRRAG
jgi:hypothetical protein